MEVPPLVCACVRSVFSEITGVSEFRFLLEFLGIDDDECARLKQQFIHNKSGDNVTVKLSQNDFRKIYEAINALLAEIPPRILHAHTSYGLEELATSARYIFIHAYDRKPLYGYWIKDLVNGEPTMSAP